MISETPWGGRKEPFFSFPACERCAVRADIKNHSRPLPKCPPPIFFYFLRFRESAVNQVGVERGNIY